MSGNKCCCDQQEQKCCEVNCRCALCRVYHRYTQCGRPSLNVMCCRGRWWKSPMKPKSKSITACCIDPKQNDNCGMSRSRNSTTCCNSGRQSGGACCPANLNCKPSPANAGQCCPPDTDPCNPCPKTCPAPCPVPCPPKMCCPQNNCCMKTITTSECGCKMPCCCPKPRPCAKSVSCCQLECQQKLCKCTYTPTFKCCPQNFPLSCCPKNNCCQTCTKDLPVCCNNNNQCNNDCNSCCRYGTHYNPAQQPMSTYTGAPFNCTDLTCPPKKSKSNASCKKKSDCNVSCKKSDNKVTCKKSDCCKVTCKKSDCKSECKVTCKKSTTVPCKPTPVPLCKKASVYDKIMKLIGLD